ncbi:MAG: hypothetical protein OHK0023_16480 [Anaerolineae bacterium]
MQVLSAQHTLGALLPNQIYADRPILRYNARMKRDLSRACLCRAIVLIFDEAKLDDHQFIGCTHTA